MIDTHCHLNDPEAFPDPAAAVQEAREAGVQKLIAIGVDVATSESAIRLAENIGGVFAAVGLHPNYTADYSANDLRLLESLLQHPKVVAFGEIGLDFFRDHSPRNKQYTALRDQLELAGHLQKPVIFHCRQAYDELLSVLEESPKASLRYVFHCFSGTTSDAVRAMALGGFFGVDGPVTYQSAKELRETLRSIPIERLLLETDSPYLPPVPHRGKPNKPAYLGFIRDALASTLGVSSDECGRTTTKSAEMLFGL